MLKYNLNLIQCIEDPLLSEGYPSEIEPEFEHLKHIKEKCKMDKHGKRISAAFEKYISRCDGPQDSHELYVIHGNVIRYFLCRSL
jgi:serine/threonine-protein phosphatase PGAM5